MAMPAHEQTRSGNRLRVLVAVLVGLETLGLLGLAVFLTAEVFRVEPSSRGFTAGLALLALVGAAGLAVCTRGVARGLRWTRGPVITWQLVQAGVALPLATSKAWWVGVPLLAVAVAVGALLAGRHVVPPAG
jgi:drug/metabolite transporter (DMT)-like permease